LYLRVKGAPVEVRRKNGPLGTKSMWRHCLKRGQKRGDVRRGRPDVLQDQRGLDDKKVLGQKIGELGTKQRKAATDVSLTKRVKETLEMRVGEKKKEP